MIPIFYDVESFWSTEHSLTKMTAPVYVMHPDTELQSIAIKEGLDGETSVLFGEDIILEWFADTDFSDAMLIAHNGNGFDHLIAAWRGGAKPRAWGDTLAMSRPVHLRDVGGSLRALAEQYGLQAKGSLESVNTKGKRLADFTPEEIRKMRVYNRIDTDICADLFKILSKKTTQREMKLIDATARMATEPQFELDMRLLRYTLSQEESRKRRVLLDLGHALDPTRFLRDNDGIDITKKELSSAAKFKKILQQWGVEVPMKPSPSDPEKQIPALAKTDEGMRGLLEHPNELVSGAAQARLDVKSTILETRLQRFIDIGEVCGGQMPVFLSYYAAVTGRWGGGAGKVNQQNMPRVDPNNKQLSDALRASLVAPEGHKVVSVDLAGIELRVGHFLAQVTSSMQLYQESPDDADLYVAFAAKHMYGIAEEDVTKDQRFVGKIAQLSLMYGGAAKTFQAFARNYGRHIPLDEAKHIVDTWRMAYPALVREWTKCGGALQLISNKQYGIKIDPWGMCTTAKGGIKTPLGMIRYPNLRQETIERDGVMRKQWVYGDGRKKTYIYGAKCFQNLTQHLAREVIADNLLAFAKTPLGKKYQVAMCVHDELIYVVREEDAQDVLDEVNGIMRGGVSWWPELITSSEGAIGDNYAAVH